MRLVRDLVWEVWWVGVMWLKKRWKWNREGVRRSCRWGRKGAVDFTILLVPSYLPLLSSFLPAIINFLPCFLGPSWFMGFWHLILPLCCFKICFISLLHFFTSHLFPRIALPYSIISQCFTSHSSLVIFLLATPSLYCSNSHCFTPRHLIPSSWLFLSHISSYSAILSLALLVLFGLGTLYIAHVLGMSMHVWQVEILCSFLFSFWKP